MDLGSGPIADALNTRPKYEMNLLIVPVVVGQGTRLFPDSGPDMALDLVKSRAFPKGVTIQVYRPAGRPQYATG
jgi:dihydrofolate reductase